MKSKIKDVKSNNYHNLKFSSKREAT